MIENRTPPPFHVAVHVLRIGAIVVAQQLQPDGDRQGPAELRIITWMSHQAMMEVEQRMRERRLVEGDRHFKRWESLAVKTARSPLIKAPPANAPNRST